MSWLVLLLVTDVVYSGMVIQGSYVDGGLIDSGWLIGYVVLAAAALHPSMADRVVEQDHHSGRTIGGMTWGSSPLPRSLDRRCS